MNKLNIMMYSIAVILIIIMINPVVTASTVSGTIPDICIPQGIDGEDVYKIWLTDYYTFDFTETVTIDYDDPDGSGEYSIPPNYASLNDECFEVSYQFEDRGAGFYEDVLRFQSYNANCNADILVNLHDTSGIDQEFNLEVSNLCNTTYSGPTPEYNITGSFLDNVVSYYSFDNTVYDSINQQFATQKAQARYNQSGLYGPAYVGNWQGSKLQGPAATMDDGNFTYSIWFKSQPNAENYEVIECGGGTSDTGITVMDDASIRIDNGNQILDIDGQRNGEWQHIVIIREDDDTHVYSNGTFIVTFPGSSSTMTWDHCDLQFQSNQENHTIVDDLLIFDSIITSGNVNTLYNSGNGYDFSQYNFDPQSSTSIADINMVADDTATILFDTYFSNWSTVYVHVNDPINNYEFVLGPGYSTLNADYFEVYNYANHLNITSYLRPYNFDVKVRACGTGLNPVCENRTFNVDITAPFPDVNQIGTFQASYDLDFDGTQLFSGNAFFQYYETITFAFPESNFSNPDFGHVGPLNGTWNYTIITEPLLNASFMVFLECNINDPYEEYTFLGDLNVTVECGNGQAYFTTTAYNNYGQTVYFTARNNHSSEGDYTVIYAGNQNVPSGYIPSAVDSTTQGIDDNVNSFGTLLPTDLTQTNKSRFVFLIIAVVSVIIFAGLFKVSTQLAFYTVMIVDIILLFLFVSADYLSPVYPILLTFIAVVMVFFKIIRGGA